MAVSIDRAIAMNKIFIENENSVTNRKKSKPQRSNTLESESPAKDIKEISSLLESLSSQNVKSINTKTKVSFFVKFFFNNYVDLVTFIIFVLIFALNFHYIYLLDLEISVSSVENLIESGNFSNYEYRENESTESENFSAITFSCIKSKLDDLDPELKYSCFAERSSRYEFFLTTIWFWIDLVVYSLLPFSTMTICSIIIMLKIKEINKKYQEQLINEDYKSNKNIYLTKLKKNRQIYFMLLYTDLYFLFIMVKKNFCFN